MSEDPPIFGKRNRQSQAPPSATSPKRGGDGPPTFSPASDPSKAPSQKSADNPATSRPDAPEKRQRPQPTQQAAAPAAGASARPIRPAEPSVVPPAAPVRPESYDAGPEAQHSPISPGLIGAIGAVVLIVLAAAGFLALDDSGFFFEPPDLQAGDGSQLGADGSLTFDGGVLEATDGSSIDGEVVETADGRPLEGSESVRFGSDIVSATGDVRVRFDITAMSEATDSGPNEGYLVVGREEAGLPWHPIPALVDDDQLVADLGPLSDYALAVVDYEDLAIELGERFARSREVRVEPPTCEQFPSGEVEHSFNFRNEDLADPEVFICNTAGPDQDRTYFSVTNNRAQMLLLAAPESLGMDRAAQWAEPVFLRGVGLDGLQAAQSSTTAVMVEGGETATISLWADQLRGNGDVIQTRYSFVDDMISTFLWGGGNGGFGAFSASVDGGAETKTVGGLDASSQRLHTMVSECVGDGVEDFDIIRQGDVITEAFAVCANEAFADGTGATLAESIRRVPGERLLTQWNQGIDNSWGEIEVTPGPTGDADLAELWEQAPPPCAQDFRGSPEEARIVGVAFFAAIMDLAGEDSEVQAGRLVFHWPRSRQGGEASPASVGIVYVAEDGLECGRISGGNLESGGRLVEVPTGEEAMRRLLEGLDTELLFRGQERLDADRELRDLVGEIRRIGDTNASAVAVSQLVVSPGDDVQEGCALPNADSPPTCEVVSVFRTRSAEGSPIATYRLIYSEMGIEEIEQIER